MSVDYCQLAWALVDLTLIRGAQIRIPEARRWFTMPITFACHGPSVIVADFRSARRKLPIEEAGVVDPCSLLESMEMHHRSWLPDLETH
ncbi:hypothetical protein ACLOJK_004417, partial [Asimina triloba]